MRHSLVLLALLPLAACAHRGAGGTASRSCKPVADEPRFAAYGHVYAACEVERQARPQVPPMQTPLLPRAAASSQGCASAEVEFVIDAAGRVIPESVRLLRSTDAAYGESAVRTVSGTRYAPAERQGVPVAQVGRMKMQTGAVVVVRGGSAPPSGRPPAC